jgi:hypothetical protein
MGEGQTIILINLSITEQMCCQEHERIQSNSIVRDYSIEDIVSSQNVFQ